MKNKKILLIGLILLVLFGVATYYFFIKYPTKIKIENKNQQENKIEEKTDNKTEESIQALKEVFLSTNKNEYGPNEEVEVSILLRNPFPETKKWLLAYYFSAQELGGYSALGQTEELELKPGETRRSTFSSAILTSLVPGNYVVRVEVLEKEKIISQKSKVITIEGTKKIINAELKTCSEIECNNDKVVFIQNETIYIQVSAEMADLNVIGKIKYPKASDWQNFDFSQNKATIVTDQLGAYELIVDIAKDGYQDLSINKDFAVIAAEPGIKSTSKCNGNGRCDNSENRQNCPQDCN